MNSSPARALNASGRSDAENGPGSSDDSADVPAGTSAGRHGCGPPYVSPLRRTTSAIQIGANGDVQFGGVG
jgi:hypothetical protein